MNALHHHRKENEEQTLVLPPPGPPITAAALHLTRPAQEVFSEQGRESACRGAVWFTNRKLGGINGWSVKTPSAGDALFQRGALQTEGTSVAMLGLQKPLLLHKSTNTLNGLQRIPNRPAPLENAGYSVLT